MTVIREQQNTFHFPAEQVIEAIRYVLNMGSRSHNYTKVRYDEPSRTFNAVIKPTNWPLVLSTRLSIQVVPSGEHTNVHVQTHSQPYILGDIGNIYRGYIATVLLAITQRVEYLRTA